MSGRLLFVVDFILSKTKGDIVATVSTSRMLDDIAANHSVTIHRTKVGVGWVVEKMREIGQSLVVKALVAWSILMYTTQQMGLPSLAAITQYLAESGSTVTRLLENIPQYQMCRKKLEIPSQEVAARLLEFALKAYREEYEAETEPFLELTDGVKTRLERSMGEYP